MFDRCGHRRVQVHAAAGAGRTPAHTDRHSGAAARRAHVSVGALLHRPHGALQRGHHAPPGGDAPEGGPAEVGSTTNPSTLPARAGAEMKRANCNKCVQNRQE